MQHSPCLKITKKATRKKVCVDRVSKEDLHFVQSTGIFFEKSPCAELHCVTTRTSSLAAKFCAAASFSLEDLEV